MSGGGFPGDPAGDGSIRFITDRDFRLVDADSVFFKIAGIDPATAIGNRLFSILDGADGNRGLQDACAELIRANRETAAVAYFPADGPGGEPYEFMISPLGRFLLFTGRPIGADINPQPPARLGADEYVTLFETIDQGVLYLDSGGRIISANPAAGKILGVDRNTLCGQSLAELCGNSIGEDGAPLAGPESPAHLILNPGTEVRDVVMGYLNNADGRRRWLSLSAIPVMTGGSNLPRQIIVLFSDYTHQKMAEEAFKDSELKFKTFAETIPAGILIHRGGKLLYVNPEVINKTGYSRDELLSMNYYEIIHPDHRRKAMEYARARLQGADAPDRYLLKVCGKHGETFWYYMAARQVPIGGEPSVIVTALDITDLKKAERLLLESEEKFSKAFNASTSMMAILRLNDHVVLDVNKAFLENTGYEKSEIIGTRGSELDWWADEDLPAYIRQIVFAEKQSIRNLEMKFKTRNNEIRFGIYSNDFIEINNEPCVFVTIADITEYKKIEESIRQSEEKFSRLFQSSPYPMVLTRLADGKFLAVNDAYLKVSGFAREEVLNRSSDVLNTWTSNEERDRYLAEIRGKGFVRNFETRFRTRHGDLRQGFFSAEVIDLFGEKCVLVQAVDITERVLLHEELKKHEKLESIGVLAGGIAHDFNNILTAVLGNISLAKRNIAENAKAFERLSSAEGAVLRARDLTQQLLTFSRGGTPVLNTASLGGILCDSAEFALRGSNVRCEFKIPDDLPTAEIDEGQISRVIHNLVINAGHAMPNGGVLTIEAGTADIDSSSLLPLNPGRYIRIDVSDEGSGIPEEYIHKIFDPYFSTKHGGSGLGLTSAYSIIKNHSGHISVDSVVGRGTTFTIFLPASDKAPAAVIGDTPSGVAGIGRILVMDDEDTILEIAEMLLTEAGYSVITCGDGESAVFRYREAMADGNPFAVVIMDLTVRGGMGGKEAMQKILEIDPDAKGIVSSGYSNDRVMSHFAEYGFSAVVSKPYVLADLANTIRMVINPQI